MIKGTSPSVDRWMGKVPASSISISVVTEAELRFGLAKHPSATRLKSLVETFLTVVKIEPWDSRAAVQYGLLRAKLESDGKVMGNLDLMIAAHALALGRILVTNGVTNDGAFRRIKNLKLADWTKPS